MQNGKLAGEGAQVFAAGATERQRPPLGFNARPAGGGILPALDGDFGDEVEIRVGLNSGDHVAVSPNDELQEGEPVKEEPYVDDNPVGNGEYFLQPMPNKDH